MFVMGANSCSRKVTQRRLTDRLLQHKVRRGVRIQFAHYVMLSNVSESESGLFSQKFARNKNEEFDLVKIDG